MTMPLDAAPPETIGQRIRRLRTDAGLSQRELSHLLGHLGTAHRVQDWEHGDSHPRIGDLPAVATLLHCSADYLLSGHHTA